MKRNILISAPGGEGGSTLEREMWRLSYSGSDRLLHTHSLGAGTLRPLPLQNTPTDTRTPGSTFSRGPTQALKSEEHYEPISIRTRKISHPLDVWLPPTWSHTPPSPGLERSLALPRRRSSRGEPAAPTHHGPASRPSHRACPPRAGERGPTSLRTRAPSPAPTAGRRLTGPRLGLSGPSGRFRVTVRCRVRVAARSAETGRSSSSGSPPSSAATSVPPPSVAELQPLPAREEVTSRRAAPGRDYGTRRAGPRGAP